jgi:hypothetical protein
LARRGNLRLVLTLEPLIRQRAGLEAERVAQFDANLDSLGFTFEDTTHVMAPALSVHLDFTEPLGGETHYLLHFGDLADPAADLIGTAVVPGGAPLETVILPPARVLTRLAAGEQVSLTAVRLPETGTGEADAVYSLPLTPVGQARSVTALLAYMSGGQLGRDLTALSTSGGAPGR